MNERQLTRRLMMGEVICQVTNEAAIAWLQHETNVHEIEQGLNYVGMKISHNELKTYFYASYQDLRDKEDEVNLRKRLQDIVDMMHPLFQFLDMVTKANNEDSFPAQGHSYTFAQLLWSIENNDALAELLSSLSNQKYFNKARSKTNAKDRLTSLMDILVVEGLLHSDSARMRFEVTGKFDYYVSMYHHIVSLDNPEIIAEDEPEQSGLGF
jgi:hypothetical protein